MPELPEVETTVRGLQKEVLGKKILDVWSDYHKKTAHGHKENLKNKKYYLNFKEKVVGKKILEVERRGKNILFRLSGDITILTHMKMTGHYLVGTFKYDSRHDTWQATEGHALKDPFNKFIHLVFSLSKKKYLALSDVRKFAKIIFFNTKETEKHLEVLGPDPLNEVNLQTFKKRILSRPGPIKSILMNQQVFAGIGNIYSDEMLWEAGVHPEEISPNISEPQFKKMYQAMKRVLEKSIGLGGDSTSDYRNIKGERGGFQKQHKVYRRKGENCLKKDCSGVIKRIVVRGRSSHFCPLHQKKV